MLQPNVSTSRRQAATPAEVEALIDEARRRQRRRRRWLAITVTLVAATVGIGFSAIRRDGSIPDHAAGHAGHVCISSTPGWRSRAVHRPGIAPALLLTNFRFGRVDYANGHTDPLLRWPSGGILISVSDWTHAATGAMRSRFRPAGALQVAARDFNSFEGVNNLGRRQVRFDGRLLEVWVQARPTTTSTIAAANRELANVRLCG